MIAVSPTDNHRITTTRAMSKNWLTNYRNDSTYMNEKYRQQQETARNLLSHIDHSIVSGDIDELNQADARAHELMVHNWQTSTDTTQDISFYDITEYADFLRRHFEEITRDPRVLDTELSWIKKYREGFDLE
ncbi:hypothetical protein [Amycolatopsis sp. H20-H5]|uniref:hypothetical protein n=1 Tax=Amycolatopsis sp. H20-H5 TaxID=3046309 RepID=UPI002DB6CAEB|nr:hypothetical protein [Amycolatopsis sp. H20-H5]MEC3979646.1 hypothetical protein [Amycolatopsis sp. H20-H5]